MVVLDGQGRPTAWPWLRQLKGETIHAGTEDLINLDHRATLNDALDTMLTNSHGGAVVTGDRDPGYGSTSKMIAEAALCLVQDVQGDGGIWTPGALMGATLRDRLVAKAGLTFTVG